MVPQKVSYDSELRCTATHGPSGVEITTDAPTDNMGRGESFSPTDLLVTALVSCMLTTMGIFAEKHDVKLDGMKAAAEKYMTANGPRRVERIVVRIEFCPCLAVDMRPRLENAAMTCPVARSLSGDVIQEVSFAYPD